MHWHGMDSRNREISFNPRPTVRSGDAPESHARQQWAHGFNPRPTVRSGDAHVRAQCNRHLLVSIRARP